MWLFPYLSAAEPADIGACRVVPRQDFTEADAVEPWMAAAALDHLNLYKLPMTGGAVTERFGCIVSPRGGRVGDALDRSWMQPLQRAVVAAVLEEAPTEREPGPWSAATSDNANLYGHRLREDGEIGVTYGYLARRTVVGINVGDSKGKIPPPIELALPLLASPFDAEYAHALYSIMAGSDQTAQRFERAIGWLDLAWRNTDSVDRDMRIVALRCAFEVLLGAGEHMKKGRAVLSALLDAPGAPKMARSYPNRQGTGTDTEDLTDLEWWFTKFCFLRNAIAHGNVLQSDDFLFEGEEHFFLAERRLRQAIRKKVTDRVPELAIKRSERRLRRELRKAGLLPSAGESRHRAAVQPAGVAGGGIHFPKR